MVDTGRIRAGRAYVELLADDSKLAAGLRAAAGKLRAFGATIQAAGLRMMALGGAILAPLALSVRNFANVGSALHDMSQRTGLSVEALSALSYAAEQSGADIESLEKGIRKMQRTITDAAGGSKSAADALGSLGLTVKDLAGLAPEKQFRLLADRLDKVADATAKAALAMEIFGRSGTALLPMLRGGAAGLQAFQAQAEKLGIIMSTQDAAAADALGDAFLDVRKAAKFASVAVGASLAPELMKLARGMIAGVARVTAWIQAHRELAVMALRVGGAIVGVGAALVAMGAALKLAAFAAGGLALMITLPARALLLTVGIIKGAVVALMSLHGIMLGVGAAFVIASGAGSKALSWLGERFRDLRDVALEAWSGIADALAAGDIPTAAQILWAALKLEWVKGRQSLEGVWRGAKDAFLDVFDAIKFGGWALWADFVAGMQSMWALGLGAMGKVMTQWAISRASAINDVSVGLAVFKEMYEGKPGSESRIDAIYNLRDQMRADLEKTRTEAWSAADLVTAQALLDAAAQKEQTYLEIAKADQATGAARAEATRKELAASRAELAKAIEDYYEALAYGAQSKWLSEGGSAAMDRLRGSRLAIEGAGGAGGLGVGVSGTFAAAAVRSLEAPRLDRIAKAAEATAEAAQQTAANTRSLRDATGPQFA